MSASSQVSTLEAPRAPVQPQAAAKVAAKVKSNGHDVALSGKRASITIHQSEGIGGEDAVVVGLNGFMYQIPRGTPQDVPLEVLMILENAITSIVSTDKAGAEVRREIPRHNISVHGRDKLDA